MDRGTDLAAIRVRRAVAVVPLLLGLLAAGALLDTIAGLLTLAVFVVGVVWLFRRPASSPPIPDLRDAVRAGDVDAVRRMLQRGADPNATRWDRSLLDEARAGGEDEIVRLLIAFGAKH